MLDELVAAIDNRSSHGIAAAIGRLASAGALPVGTRLPTVRELARALGVSPTTVGEAWKLLAAVGVIDARGRQGTFVRVPPGPGGDHRYQRTTAGPATFALDLSTGFPDPRLLPELGPVLAEVSRQPLTSSYRDRPVLPALRDHLLATWPFAAEELTVVDGALDAIDRVAREVVRLGDRVVVEDPTYPPVLDLFEQLGAEVIGVRFDADGISLAELASALEYQPRLLFLQPRAHNPTGTSMTAERARAVARLLAPGTTLVLEDDHSGDVATSGAVSIGTWLPDRTVHVRGYAKSHGPDLRLAALGGAADVVDAVTDRRLLGPAWSSRILQAVLLTLLTDPAAIATVAAARDEYARRRRVVATALAERGVATGGTDGLNLWVPVIDERDALVALAAQGIGAAAGEPFGVRPGSDHIRLTVGLVHGPEAAVTELADRVAAAAAPLGPWRGRHPA